MLRLLFSRNQNALNDSVLRQSCAEMGAKRALIIVPEQYSHMMERRLCRLCGDAASLYAEVLSFSRLAQHVFQEVGGAARPTLEQGGRVLLMHLAVRRMRVDLQAFRRSGENINFLSGLLNTLNECKSCCITPEMLIEAGETSENGGARLRELGMIFAAYDALTAERAEDPRDRLTRLADTLAQSHYCRGQRIYLLGFTDFTPQEKRLIEVFLRKAQEVTVALRCDTLATNGEALFEPTRRTALSMQALAAQVHTPMHYEILPAPEDRARELCFLEQGLFDESAECCNAPASHIFCCKADSPYNELERVAEEILYLVQEKEVRFRDICVAARTMDEWSARMETVFSRYDIPIFLARKDDILQKPVLALITAALDTLAGDYEYEDVFRYLKSGLTGIARADVDALENYVLRWDIRASRWHGEKDWSWHPLGYGQNWTDEDRETLQRLNALRREITRPLESLRKCGAETGREWAMAVYRFLEQIALAQCLTERTQELRRTGALQQAEEYRQVWQVLVSALEQCADLLAEDALSLGAFTDLFRLVLCQYQVGSIPVSLDRVTCGEMNRVSHNSCNVLFLVGADDESLPQVNRETGLLTEEDRQTLSMLGAETALDMDQQLDRELMLIYECCTAAKQRLYVSYAAFGADGAEKQPSFLLQRLQELFPQGLGRFVERGVPSAMAAALELAAAGGDRAMLETLAQLPQGEGARRALRAMDATRENLSATAVKALYGDTIRLSASRMDKVNSCHYAYFLQYGLRARVRKPAGLDAPEAGTFVHYVLEHVLDAAKSLGGVKTLAEETVRRLSEQATQQYIAENIGGMEDKAPRFRYLFNRLAESAFEVVAYMIQELQCSDFEPIAFELGFGAGKELPPVQVEVDGVTVSVTGFVDRVDGWVHDGKLYVRVMDYKTGAKKFDLTDIWHGLNLQMLLYLFALQAKGLPNHACEVVPAGVLYLPAREGSVSAPHNTPPEQVRRELEKTLRRSGIVLNEPTVVDAMEHIPLGSEARFLPVKVAKKTGAISGDALVSAAQLGKLRGHIQRTLSKIGREIINGDIQANPWYRSDMTTACSFCDWATACHFADGLRGEHSRYLTPCKGEKFWEELDRVAGDEGGQA